MSGLPQHVKFCKLWHAVCACGIKNTQSLLFTSRDAASWKNAHTGPITLQENLLAVIRPNFVCKGFWDPSTLSLVFMKTSPWYRTRKTATMRIDRGMEWQACGHHIYSYTGALVKGNEGPTLH